MELFVIFPLLFVLACGRSIEHENVFSTSDENESVELESLFNNTNDQNGISEVECDCDWRYFKHYEIRGCVLEKVDSCGCPKKFSCPENQTSQFSSKVCVYRNKEYSVGSKIITDNMCQKCRCRDGDPPFLSCTHKECPEVEWAPRKNCHLVYEENRCCPVIYKCLTVESEDESVSNKTTVESEDESSNNKICEYNGQMYPFGSKIYPVDDPCQICICNENWNGVDNTSCYQQDCVLEQSKSKLDAGCIPVYHESRCCPIEFYCPSSHNFTYSLLSINESEINATVTDDQCIFGGKNYNISHQLHTDNPCVMCQCLVPPDFTCIHQTCPLPPNDENCYPIHNKEECCPAYECMYSDAEPESNTEGCPTPLCADSSCHIETPPGHECPTCVCGERVSELEHNEVQQVQQINQGVEPYQQVNEGPRETSIEDYSEDDLQMMPIRIQDAESQSFDMERIVLPGSDFVEKYSEEDFREMEDSSSENNSSTETIFAATEEALNEQNPETIFEQELDETEKEVQKRSNTAQVSVPQEQIFGSIPENNEDIEREGETFENNGDFEDELEHFKNKIFDKNGTIINEILSINHEVQVPAGCPTPMCEGPWCKVGIPPGHKCPTCICKRKSVKCGG